MLNHDDASEKRQSSLLSKRDDGEIFRFVDSQEASGLTGVDVQFDGLFFEDAGYILPEELCEFLIDSPKINLLILKN